MVKAQLKALQLIKSPSKKQWEGHPLVQAMMYVLLFVFLVHLAISMGQKGVPVYPNNQWIMDENSQYYDTDGEFPLREENYVSHANSSEEDGMLGVNDKDLQTTPESSPLLDPGSQVPNSRAWAIGVITFILLAFVFVLVTLGIAYYLYFWRGGRIHYRPQVAYA